MIGPEDTSERSQELRKSFRGGAEVRTHEEEDYSPDWDDTPQR
jgi:hypothetical protein